MNNKGWIKIVEAFISILLITGVVLIIISEESFSNLGLDSEIYESQLITLRDIQMNNIMRQDVLDVTAPTESIPQRVKDRINYFSPDYLECKAKICDLVASCNLDNSPEKEVYAQTVAITSTSTEYKPRQLKLFCWSKL